MNKGYLEVNYNVYIKNGNKYYKFAKKSIVNNVTKEPPHKPINSVYVYDIFYMLYPILKEIKEEYIQIQKGWDSWHPLCGNMEIPINEYNKRDDEYITNVFKDWYSKQNLMIWKSE